MTEHRIIERETATEQAVEPRETIEKDFATGVPHGDEEAGGAVGGAVGGAIVGAVVGGPVGAVVGGAIGAAAGATGGALDQKVKDDKVVVTREVRRS
jgi:outer membrane lipoprotein SlyB